MSFSCGVIVSFSEFHNWENRLIIQFNYTLGGRRLNENLEFQNDDYKASSPDKGQWWCWAIGGSGWMECSDEKGRPFTGYVRGLDTNSNKKPSLLVGIFCCLLHPKRIDILYWKYSEKELSRIMSCASNNESLLWLLWWWWCYGIPFVY